MKKLILIPVLLGALLLSVASAQYNPGHYSVGTFTGSFSGDFTGTFNGTVGATTPNTGAFTTLTGNHKEEIEPASDSILATQCRGNVINNYGQTANTTLSLPTAVGGLKFTVILGTTDAHYFRLDPGADDLIILDGVASTNGKYIGVASATQGAAVSCLTITTGSGAYDWACYTVAGPWEAE